MNTPLASTNIVEIPFHCIRNISSPEDLANGRTVHAGQLPIAAILGLPTNENVRGYLVDAEGKQKRTKTQVHRAIEETLKERRDMFSVLNGGIVVVAKGSETLEKEKVLRLFEPSIINGSQTQGVIRDFLSGNQPDDPIHIKFELIICNDPGLVAEISIARNFQNDVHMISIVGRRGHLDDLENRLQLSNPEIKLQKSETQRPAESNDYLQTEKLIQVITALMPSSLWWKSGDPNKVYTYSQKTTCLKEFEFVYQKSHDDSDDEEKQKERQKFAPVYQYFIDIAPEAWSLYNRWKNHQGFKGTGLRAITRENGTIVDVPDGIIFPIISAFSEFVIFENGSWQIKAPVQFAETELIQAAKTAYMDIANSKPEIMGKNRGCYTAIQTITALYKKLLM